MDKPKVGMFVKCSSIAAIIKVHPNSVTLMYARGNRSIITFSSLANNYRKAYDNEILYFREQMTSNTLHDYNRIVFDIDPKCERRTSYSKNVMGDWEEQHTRHRGATTGRWSGKSTTNWPRSGPIKNKKEKDMRITLDIKAIGNGYLLEVEGYSSKEGTFHATDNKALQILTGKIVENTIDAEEVNEPTAKKAKKSLID